MVDESFPAKPELNKADWPELIACKVMPGGNDESIEVEVADAEGNKPTIHVPKESVAIINMPQISDALRAQDAPEEIMKTIEDDISLGLLSCRIIERFDDKKLVRIELPAQTGDLQLLVASESLARRR